MNKTIFSRYGFVWITLIFFLGSLALHFIFGWKAYADEQNQFGFPTEVREYLNQILRDIFENWQSEFLQLIWQVMGLAYLLYLGSPQSKEGDDRKEEKIDSILRFLNKNEGDEIIKNLDKKYPRK